MDMERFLRYSLGQAVVERMENGRVALYVMRPPRRLEIPAADVLGASYTAKDEGQ